MDTNNNANQNDASGNQDGRRGKKDNRHRDSLNEHQNSTRKVNFQAENSQKKNSEIISGKTNNANPKSKIINKNND